MTKFIGFIVSYVIGSVLIGLMIAPFAEGGIHIVCHFLLSFAWCVYLNSRMYGAPRG